MPSQELARKCPRCGDVYSYVKERRQGNRVYLYAVHYLGYVDRRKKTRECYLGPEGGYEYVSKLHDREGLRLRGLADSHRVIEYLDTIISYVSSSELDQRLRLEIAEKVLRLLRALGIESQKIPENSSG